MRDEKHVAAVYLNTYLPTPGIIRFMKHHLWLGPYLLCVAITHSNCRRVPITR